MLTLRQLAYFEALAETRHFGHAAQRVHVSQPALSAQIAEMEARLGCQLFERTRGAAILTEAGERLLPQARSILSGVRAIEDSMASGGGLLSGRLRAGMIPTLAPYLLPALVPALSAAFPDLEFGVREAITETLVTSLRNGELDVAIAALPLDDAGLKHRFLFEDRFVMAVSDNEHAVLDSPLNRHGLPLDRLLLLEEGHCLRDQALDVCGAQGEAALVQFGATSLTTLLQMVTHGMGMTLLPEIAIGAEALQRPSLRLVRFASPEPSRRIALFWRATSERARDFEAFADLVATTCAKVATAGRSAIAGGQDSA